MTTGIEESKEMAKVENLPPPAEGDGGLSWFKLGGDARLGRCASERCGGQPTWRLEAGGIGSNFCSGCKEIIEREEREAAEYERDRAAALSSIGWFG